MIIKKEIIANLDNAQILIDDAIKKMEKEEKREAYDEAVLKRISRGLAEYIKIYCEKYLIK